MLAPRSIKAVHYGVVGADRLALWPAPVGHDLCFREAGFEDFAETDHAWDAEFRSLAGRLLEYLSLLGAPIVKKAPEVRRAGFGRLLRGASDVVLLDRVILSAHDDRFGEVIVDFGDPPIASMRVAGGHPVFWVRIPADRVQDLLRHVAEGRPAVQTHLAWDKLG